MTALHPVLTVPPADCPTCREAVRPVPRRGGACPHCGAPYVVRSRQELFPSSLLTPAQARAWREYNRSVRQFGDELAPLRTALQREQDASERLDDVVELWYRAIVQTAPAHPWRWLERLAWHRLACGRDYVSVLQEARSLELAAIQREHRRRQERRPQPPPWIVRIVPDQPGALCDPCTAVAGREVPIEPSLGITPLPVADCTCVTGRVPGFCGCWYSAGAPRRKASLAEWWAILSAFDALHRRAW